MLPHYAAAAAHVGAGACGQSLGLLAFPTPPRVSEGEEVRVCAVVAYYIAPYAALALRACVCIYIYMCVYYLGKGKGRGRLASMWEPLSCLSRFSS